MSKALQDVKAERLRQDNIHGDVPSRRLWERLGGGASALLRVLVCASKSTPEKAEVKSQEMCDRAWEQGSGTLIDILTEEFFEVIAAPDTEAMRTELVQVAAVALMAVESIDAGNLEPRSQPGCDHKWIDVTTVDDAPGFVHLCTKCRKERRP